VRFNFEGARPSIAYVDDSCVLARSLQYVFAAGRQALQMHARRFVGAVLAPHHAEDAEFSEGRFAPTKKLPDFLVFFGGKTVLVYGLRRDSGSHRSGHGEVLLSHFDGLDGSALCLLLLESLAVLDPGEAAAGSASGKILIG
jgi:hypothetical protein